MKPARKSRHFNAAKHDQFVGVLGAPKAERAAARFLELLGAAFKSTPQIARREAHDLINLAGLFGFDALVEICRAIDQLPAEEMDRVSAMVEEARTAQSRARGTLVGRVLPNLRGVVAAEAMAESSVTSSQTPSPPPPAAPAAPPA